MTLWKKTNNANSAPKFVTDAAKGETGIQEYGDQIFLVTGSEGYPVSPGWARKTIRGSRVLWESVATFRSPYVAPPTLGTLAVSNTSPTVGQPYNATVLNRTPGSTLALSGVGAAGLSINSVTGVITGTPTTAGVFNIIETLNGATGSPKTTSSVATVISNIPFTQYDAQSYWWDFTSNTNTVDNSLDTPTLSRAKEQIANKATFGNDTKATQPLVVAGGINFNSATNRVLRIEDDITSITNGKNGYYVAFTFTPNATNGSIFGVARNGGTTLSRLWIDFTGSRNIRLRYGAADSNTLTSVFTSAQLTLGQKYAIEVLFDCDADTVTLWINGVSQTLTITGAPFDNFPASNPSFALIGNQSTGGLSLDGVLNNLFFQDGIPSAAIRNDQSAFQQVRRA